MKTFTCKELGGVCGEIFGGNSIEEIMQKAGPHMMSDEDHKKNIMSMEERTGENKEQWMMRIKQEFDTRPEVDM